jgi:subtilisin family serine protease
MLSVAAVGQGPGVPEYTVAWVSNTRAMLAGPGVDVTSAAAGGGLTSKSGTSMATPHVAGVAALWAQQRVKASGSFNVQQLQAFLVGQVAPIAGAAADDVGAGMVRAPQA